MSLTEIKSSDPYHSRSMDHWEAVPRVDPVTGPRSPGPLTNQELEQYERDGLLFFPDLLAETEIDALLAEAQSLADEWPESRPGLVREPQSNVVRSIFRLHQISNVYQQLFRDRRLVDRARQLLGSELYIHQSRVNYKPALDGKEFFWHSDFETWHVEDGMPRMRALSISIFLTESHEFNGPLMLIPGSHLTYIRCAGETPENHHQQSLRRQQYGVPTREALLQLTAERGIVAPKGRAGSVVFFDCNTMHGSSGNLSPSSRVNLFAVYNTLENSVVDPFCERPPRPNYLAEREIAAI